VIKNQLTNFIYRTGNRTSCNFLINVGKLHGFKNDTTGSLNAHWVWVADGWGWTLKSHKS